VGLTPDESEVWVTDGANNRLHIFDNRRLSATNAPRYITSIEVRDQPGWVTFSLDGKLAYPSTGDVIDVTTKKIITQLTDETGAAVQSEKLLELDFLGRVPIRAGDQFGLGRARK
jgi:DNA-binding beta-propeller fold protein YncE